MKKRTLNEYRQTKEYKLKKLDEEITKVFSPHKLEVTKCDTKEKKLKKLEEAHKIPEEIQKIQEELEYKDVEFDDLNQRDIIEEAKIEIVEKIVKHLDDIIFEKVCNEMGKRHVFQSSNYLTEAGMDEFEDQFYEFYHEHHGDILAAIHNKLIY